MTSYKQIYSTRNKIIGISGIIGVGKSTLSKNLVELMDDYEVMNEMVDENEYLDKFYHNMRQYSFPMQIALLNHRFKQYQKIIWSDKNYIQDRTIYEDVIFAKMLRNADLLDSLDFQTYCDLFSNMSNFLKPPNLIIYLDVEPEEALERIRQRNRDCESEISIEYLVSLKNEYENWLIEIEEIIPVIRINWNNYMESKELLKIISDFFGEQ